MQFLFDSHGGNIANEEMGRLHAPSGRNIGHYLIGERIFIDQRGRYLGEVVLGNRLMANPQSPHRAVQFAVRGDYGTSGNLGRPHPAGNVAPVVGFKDIPARRLR